MATFIEAINPMARARRATRAIAAIRARRAARATRANAVAALNSHDGSLGNRVMLKVTREFDDSQPKWGRQVSPAAFPVFFTVFVILVPDS